VFAKAKAEIRRPKPQTVADTERLCGESLDWFHACECQTTSVTPDTARKGQTETALGSAFYWA
jgi:hypothetical protein